MALPSQPQFAADAPTTSVGASAAFLPSPRPNMRAGDGNWPNLLQEATCEVFSTMLGCDATMAPPGTDVAPAEFTATVGLAGSLRGLCILYCSSEAANFIASKLLGTGQSKTTDDTWDAFGEICNMVAGNFKHKLVGISEHCMLSCPTVISGRDYRCRPSGAVESTSLTMSFGGHLLGVVLQVHKQAP